MTERPTILVVEDDDILAESLIARLRLEGMTPIRAATCAAALDCLRSRPIDAVVSDIRLPDGSGEDVFRADASRLARTPTIFTTAYGDIEQAVRLVKLGATDYLSKPYEIGALIDRLVRLTARHGPPGTSLDGASPAMVRVRDLAERLADRPENLVLVGPPDSGRQSLARRIHAASQRAEAPFLVVEGAALLPDGGDRLLFGSVEPGGAPGLADLVGSGTLLVAGIDEIPAEFQPRLLRFVGDRLYRPVGTADERLFAGRLVATASPRGLDEASGRLRPDLLRRFAALEIRVPALAERGGDVVALAELLVGEQAAAFGQPVRRLTADARAALLAHDWPGNLRELRNRVVRATMFAEGEAIGESDLFPDVEALRVPPEQTLESARREAECQVIETALAENGGRIVETAKALGISRVTLWSKMKRFGIARSGDGH
jgi:DNA-binding NtrC family response regulator